MKLFKRIFRLPYFPIVVAPVILFSTHLFAGKALFWGTPALQFVPWWSWAWETILDGHMPLWNPLLGMGAPLIANYQSAIFYPPNWLYFLSYALGSVGLMAWMQSVVVVLHLVWAGLGMAVLVRRFGLSRLAQTVSGLAFSLSGYLVARAWFASINAAVAWLPWIMLFSYDLTKKRSPGSVLKLGLVIGMQLLAGHAQVAWYTLLLGGMWTAFWGWQRSNKLQTPEGREKAPSASIDAQPENVHQDEFAGQRRFYALIGTGFNFGLATLLGVGLAAVQLIPTAVYLMQSQRAGAVDMEFALNYSFWPWRFIGILVPDFFGSPETGDFWGYGNYWEDAIYIGILPILLVVGILMNSIFKKERKSRSIVIFQRFPFVLFLFLIIFVSFLFALGKNTPVYPWLYEHVPTFAMFQAPTRISIWAIFCLALLAGMGIDNWRKPVGRALYWTRLGTAGAFAITLGAGLAFFAMGDVSPTFISATARAGVLALGVGVLALNRGEKPPMGWRWAVVAWVAMDLLVAGWGLNPGIDLFFYTRPQNEEIVEIIGEGRIFISVEDEDKLKYERFLRFDSFNPGKDWHSLRLASLPNLNVLDGFPSANNFDPFVPARYARWMEPLQDVDSLKREQLLDLMGVSVLEKLNCSEVYFEPRRKSSQLRWVPCTVSVESEDDAWEQVFFGEINFENTVVLEGAEPALIQDCNSAGGQMKIEHQNLNSLQISANADSAGWLVDSNVWYPGWQATVDGTRVDIQRANYLFRAVYVPEGEHSVKFEYRPFDYYIGMLISFIGIGSSIIVARKLRLFRIFLR